MSCTVCCCQELFELKDPTYLEGRLEDVPASTQTIILASHQEGLTSKIKRRLS